MTRRAVLSMAGFVIGTIEVTLDPKQIGAVEGRIRVQLAEEPDSSLVIPVSAKISAPVESYPSLLSLPRSSGQGMLYHGQCLCRAIDGRPFTLTPRSLPKGVKVLVEGGKEPSSHCLVKIEISPSEFAADKSKHRDIVRLLARFDGEECVVEIPVEYRKLGE